MIVVAVIALVLGAAGLLAARAWHWLAPDGVLAATAVGAAILGGAGPAGCFLLLFFLGSSSLLTRYRAEAKPADGREHGPHAGAAGGQAAVGRSASQVLANGGVAAVLALVAAAGNGPAASYAVAGAIAAATADSWATELGTAIRGTTRLITTLAPVPPGTSGGVSVAGTAAGASGALTAGGLAALLAPVWWAGTEVVPAGLFVGSLAGGLAGMLLDSFLGAAIEGRWGWVDNEIVNLACTLCGALVGALAAGAAGGAGVP